MTDAPERDTDSDTDLYKIGNVAKLTGIAVERLRAWERRYGLTPASREGKTRFFSATQVERLRRIKRLIDQGHPVSTLINLSDTALNERLQALAPVALEAAPTAPAVALVGTQLLMLEQDTTEATRVNVMGRWVNIDVCLPAIAALPAAEDLPDVLVVLQGSVTPESLDKLDSLPGTVKKLVIYHYATDSGLSTAADRGLMLLRWPVQWKDIEQAVASLIRAPLKAGRHAPRRFSDEQLFTIASACGSLVGSSGSLVESNGSVAPQQGLACACPAELVHLISALNAFTEHSAACGTPTADRQAPAQMPRHALIAERTSNARLELELVLEDWVAAEGLLPAPN